MDKSKRQEVIDKLSRIGYYGSAEIKDSVFLTIAAMYSASDEKIDLVDKHATQVLKEEATWNINLFREIS